MSESIPIPTDIKRFILTSIASVPHLEAIMLLRRDPQVEWDVKTMAQRLYVSEKKAEETLVDLLAAGFVAVKQNCVLRYFYYPITPEMRQMLDRVAEIYTHNLIEVSQLIHSQVGRQARKFGDAFKW